jgi:peroxiredoxin
MRMFKNRRSPQQPLHTIVLTLLLVCSVGVNLLLARKTKRLQSTLDTIESGKKILPGSGVPALQATSLSGTPVSLSYSESSSPTVIYVFSTSCGWCDRNLENIKFLATNRKDNYRFIGLSIDRDVSQLGEYVTKAKLPFPIYHFPSQLMWNDYKLGGTPMTIVVSTDGKVLEDWSGAYAQANRENVESFFKIKLPGIKPAINDASFETVQ